MCKPEGKRPLRRPRHRWEDNIKMGLWEVGVGTGSSWRRIETGGWVLVNAVMNLRVHAGNFLTS